MIHSEIVRIPIRNLLPHPSNPRKISQADLNRLCDSIRDNGYWQHRPMAVEPIYDQPGKYYILDGCQRKKALGRLKKKEALCMIYEDLTDEERKDIILRSNINNGDWETNILQAEFADTVDFESIGLHIDLPEITPEDFGEVSKPEATTDATDEEQSDQDTFDEEPKEDRMAFWFKMMGDYLYPSDNEYDIPTLLSDNQPVHLELPFTPWGVEGRYKKGITTYHFYVDDYRFEQLYKNPIKLLESGCRAVVEPNNSIHDQTPTAYAIYQIYRKRYLARYLQDCGLQIWVDLNVSHRFMDLNLCGVPDGYNAFFTRGVSGWQAHLDLCLEKARQKSGLEHPNLIVYGGGKDVEEWCKAHTLQWLCENMSSRFKGEGKPNAD